MTADGYDRYLLSKRTVDDRALNRHVLDRLRANLCKMDSPRIVEIGAGLGTMVARLVDWQLLRCAEYYLLDVDAQLLADARMWLVSWARQRGLAAKDDGESVCLQGQAAIKIKVHFIHAEIGDFLDKAGNLPPADLLVANAFLDLVDVPTMLPRLFDLLAPGGLYWFSINFDGETILQPEHASDALFMRVYHRSMDERVRYGHPAGDSQCGRHLFGHLRAAGASILAAGASDWVVHGNAAGYPDEEAHFLRQIVDTIAAELHRQPDIPPGPLTDWVTLRHQQIDQGALVYLAHQMDFLGRRP